MDYGSSHYSSAQSPAILQSWAGAMAGVIARLQETFPEGRSIVLCYRGMSGVAYATALAIELSRKDVHVKMFYVRKPEEMSHGYPTEVSYSIRRDDLFVFVDDFIAEGGTFEAVEEAVKNFFRSGDSPTMTTVCLGRFGDNSRAYVEQRNLTSISYID